MAKKIMCVDDSSIIRKLVSKSMTPNGYEIIEAENGVDALSKCPGGNIDLFIVDVNMPEMGGFEFVENIKKDSGYKNHPIVFLTTESSAEMKEKGKALGVSGWLVKPFDSPTLQKIVGMLLD